MSTTAETEFLGEEIPTEAVEVPAAEEERREEHSHRSDEEHTHEGDGMSPMCTGGGCVHKTVL
ncbi:hypothetical protein ACFV4N_25930 [Actinosynnema sp. NPDC059797]